MVRRVSRPLLRVMTGGGEAQFKALRCKCCNIIYIKLSYLLLYHLHKTFIFTILFPTSISSKTFISIRNLLKCPQTCFLLLEKSHFVTLKKKKHPVFFHLMPGKHCELENPRLRYLTYVFFARYGWLSVLCPRR